MQTALTPRSQNHVAAASWQQSQFTQSSMQWSPAPISLRDLLRIANRYKRMILAIVVPITLIVMLQQLLSPNMYRSAVHVQVELIDAVGTNQADIYASNAQRISNAVRLHRSRSAAERVIADLDLLNDPDFRKEMGNNDATGVARMQAATNVLISMINIEAEPNSDLIAIAITARSPELAARIANQLPSSVREVRNDVAARRRTELLASLEAEQGKRARIARDTAQAVADFRLNNRMLVGAGGGEDLAQLNRIATQAAAASAARAGSAARSGGVAAASSSYSTAQASSPALQTLERQHAELIAEQSRLGSSYGPNHPDVKRVESQLATVEGNMTQERARAQAAAQAVNAADAARNTQYARSDAARDAAQSARLEGIAARVEGQAYRNTVNTVQLDQLVRESTLADQAYNAIAERVEQVRAQMQMEGVSSSIVSPAVPNYDPISPAPLKMTLFALLGSGVLAFLIALVREFLDDRLRTATQIRRHFGLPTFGMLPLLPGENAPSEDPNESVVIEDPQSLFAEVARSAYCDIRALRQAGGSQIVLISSPLPGDGKSTVSLTMAAAGAAMGDRAIIIDLDLRKRGMLQRMQNNLHSPDLLDIIKGQADLDSLLPPPIAESVTEAAQESGGFDPKTITLLSAHRPVDEPAALLSSRNLAQLLTELRQRFDVIIINAPATLAVRDARAMCEFADHTIMVARWGHTTTEQMTAALELLNQGVSGVIFDHVDYAEHARRRYGDSVQFYVDASDYYSDNFQHPVGVGGHLRRILNRLRGMGRGTRPEAA